MRSMFQAAIAAGVLFCLLAPEAYAQRPEGVEDGVALALPFQTWGVRIDNPGAVVESRKMKSGRQAYVMASQAKNGIVVSITIENVSHPPAQEECRRSLEARKNSFGPPSGLRFSRMTGKAEGSDLPARADVMEFVLDQNEFAAVRQKNFFACLTRANTFVDIHISKVAFVPADQAVMEQVLQSLRFVNADALMTPAIDSTTELMAQGSRRYLAGDYKGAIAPYERALEIEDLKQRLSPDLWRVLVDNLGMSFAFTGNLEAAEGVFRFGITKDSDYPMFHYNLACTRAEKKDMVGAMEELRVAFRNRDKVIKGQLMPDPAKDDSFAPFLSNADFRQLLKELQ